MIDPLEAYESCLERLLQRLGEDHLVYGDALSFQARLLENIHNTRVHGDNEIQRTNRSVIIGHLNDLTRNVLGVSFINFCGLSIDTSLQEVSDKLLSPALAYIKAVQDIAQKAYDMFCNENDLWEVPCKRISASFHHINKPVLRGSLIFHPSSTTFFNLLEVKLNYIDDQIHKLISLINTFCPICRKTTQRARTLRAELCDKLQIFLEKDLREVSMLITAPPDKT